MPIHNADIAAIFEEIADLLEIEDANPFRVRAYRNAARTIQGLSSELATLVENREDITRIPNVGKELAAKVNEIVETGSCEALRKLHRRVPDAVGGLLKIPGLGPKRVHALYTELGIKNARDLRRAARDGRIRALSGFGEKTERRILHALETHSGKKRPFARAVAAPYAESLVAYLRKTKGVKHVEIAGSYRRQHETIGDLDILVTVKADSPVVDRFTRYDEVKEIVSQGGTRSTIVLSCGLQVDLRVVDDASLGAALQYFTGSKAHNIAVRRLGQRRGLKINEYGVFKDDRRVAGETEQSVYASVGIPYIPPELRENRGELEAAVGGGLPELVAIEDLKGDLHAHTRASDGNDTIEQMAIAARERGLQYLAITEHSKGLAIARGLDTDRLLEQMAQIDRLNSDMDGFEILKGIEVEILEDGDLDLPDAVLGGLDLVVGAVHTKFGLTRARQTRRIMRAMNHPHFSILAHPSGRLINERDPYDVDMERIIREARNRGCFLELNAQPKRLDLVDRHCQMAKEEGVLVALNSDAHSTDGLDGLHNGIAQARRGWLSSADILNTRPLGPLRKLLQATMG